VDLADELEDLTDGTLEVEVAIGESTGVGCGCSACCCCCCCEIVDIMSEDRLCGIRRVTSAKLTESVPSSEVEVEVGIVLLSDSLSESKSVATGVPRASSSALTTEIECFLVDLLLLSFADDPESSETPLVPNFKPSCT
jgi:hypothetical protein